MDVKEQVKSYLKEHGIQKQFLAKQIGISTVMLSHWFSGRIILNESKMSKIYTFISRQ